MGTSRNVQNTLHSVISQVAVWLLMVPWRGTGDQTRADDAAQVISDISGLLWQWAPVAPGGVVPADHGHGLIKVRCTSALRGRAVPPERQKINSPTRRIS